MSAETYRKAANAFWATAERLDREAAALKEKADRKREAAYNQREMAREMERKEVAEIAMEANRAGAAESGREEGA